jgi:hypothetical protein
MNEKIQGLGGHIFIRSIYLPPSSPKENRGSVTNMRLKRNQVTAKKIQITNEKLTAYKMKSDERKDKEDNIEAISINHHQ